MDPTEKGYYWCKATDEMDLPKQVVAVLLNRLKNGEFYVQKIGFETTYSVMDFTDWEGPIHPKTH
jgi:hypothetical protein